MEAQTTVQHVHETRLTQFCPFQIHESADMCQYASAENYEQFLIILRKIYVQLEMGQLFQNRAQK